MLSLIASIKNIKQIMRKDIVQCCKTSALNYAPN